MKNQTQTIGSRHLRVGLDVRERSIKIASIRLVNQAVLQSPVINRAYVSRIDIADQITVIESFDDPRISVGVYHENEGHSYVTEESGLTHISIPFTSIDDLRSLQVRVTNTQGVKLAERSYDHLVKIFDQKSSGMHAVHSFTIKDLREHSDWGKIFGKTDVQFAAARFEIYLDVAKMFRWRLRRPDGEIVADSGQGYRTRGECETDLLWIRKNAGDVPIVFLN